MFFHTNAGALKVVVGEPPAINPFNSGFGFTNLEAMYVTPWDPAAPLPADTVYWGGFARTSRGSLYVFEGTPSATEKLLGVPARTNNGICFVTSAAIGQGSTFTSPWGMVSSAGEVHVADLTFGLGFADLGAGVVSTVAGLSGATPTFTRATTATTVLSNGLIGTVASGDPRSYYDPTTLSYLGYLAEGARTNLLLSSADMRSAGAGNPVTAWTNTDTTVDQDNTTSPDGTLTGNLLTEGTAGTALVSQAVTATADVNYTVSVFMKRGNTDWAIIALVNGANSFRAWFDLGNGVAGTSAQAGTGAFVASTIKAYPNGWYLCTLTGSVGSGATAITAFTRNASANGNNTYVNNATRYQWGAQFENNVSFASSYIPTTTATVTRNADVLTYPTSPWLNASAGTLFTQANPNALAGATQVLFAVDDGTANEVIRQEAGSAANLRLSVVDGGVAQALLSSGVTMVSGSTFKVASAYALNDFAISANGQAATTDTSGTLPTVTTAGIGCTSAGGSQFFGPIKSLSYSGVRLSNSVLQGMTS